MLSRHIKLIHRLLNLWFTSVILIILSSYLPHWENVEFTTWIVYMFKFWFLICITFIIKKEIHNRDIFINFAFLFSFDVLAFINLFMGDNYLFGSNKLAYLVFQYNTIFYHWILSFCLLYIFIKIVFPQLNQCKRYILTLSILFFILSVTFSTYFLDPSHAIISKSTNEFLSDLFKRTFQLNIFSLLTTIFYGIYIYKKNRVVGEYINVLIAFFFIYLFSDLIHNLSIIYNFRLYQIRLILLVLNYCFLSYILLKKLTYTYSDFGQFYEGLLAGQKNTSNIRIIPRNQSANSLTLRVLKIYILQRRGYLLTLLVLLGIGIFFFELPTYFTLNLVGLIFGLSIILVFYDLMYRKREQQKIYL